ncbi:MAG: ABC transporter ATP-binding protein [Alphaproteobacteria bacterium]|nr:ABC transporter ATP-binding protein [Alphaproteobacteria bacterium]
MSQAQALCLESLHVSYGAFPAVRDVSLSVPGGAIYGLMGLNGAGKTTMIKAILGLRSWESGTIVADGSLLPDRLAKSRIAYLPERFDPPPFLKGREFIRFSLALYGRKEDPEAINQAARDMALDPAALDLSARTYSKGMRQKLGLIATLLTGCPLLILDEPMSGLDPRARALVKEALCKARGEGRTVFLSSHILGDMDEICDQVALLHQGRILYEGSPADLKKAEAQETLEKAFLSRIDRNPPNTAGD